MPISFVGSVSADTGNLTLTGVQSGDVCILVQALDGVSNSRPSGTAAWPQIAAGSNNFQFSAVYAHTVTALEGAAGSVTDNLSWGGITASTTALMFAYRGVASINPTVVSQGGASTTVTYGALTLSDSDGSSMVVAIGYHRSVNGALQTPPAGLSNRMHVIDSVDQLAVHDGLRSSWPSTDVAIGGTSSGWRAYVLELVASASGAITLAANVLGDAATSAALATRITAASTVLGVSSVNATLSTQLTLAADVLGVAEADGALFTEIRIPADVLGSAAVAAALATRTTVAALIEGAGDVAGQISIGVTISAAALGAALVDAGIVTRIQLAGQVAGESAVVARLAGDPINVGGEALGSGAVDGLISTRIALPAEILGAGMLGGGIVVRVPMGAIIDGVGQVSAGLVTAILAGADVAGSSNVQAVIVVTAGLSARPHPDWTIRSPGHAYRVKR